MISTRAIGHVKIIWLIKNNFQTPKVLFQRSNMAKTSKIVTVLCPIMSLILQWSLNSTKVDGYANICFLQFWGQFEFPAIFFLFDAFKKFRSFSK